MEARKLVLVPAAAVVTRKRIDLVKVKKKKTNLLNQGLSFVGIFLDLIRDRLNLGGCLLESFTAGERLGNIAGDLLGRLRHRVDHLDRRLRRLLYVICDTKVANQNIYMRADANATLEGG